MELLDGRKPIGNKSMFKKKMNVEGKVDKYTTLIQNEGFNCT